MMKKIGILTFQRTVNYGAQFQNYALQEYLKKNNNCIVEVIDYQNEKINETEIPSSLFKKKSIKEFIKYFKCNKYHVAKWNKFEQFREEHIKYSEPCDKKGIIDISKLYDGIIVGSDQIWNTDITGEDYTYYLDFENNNNKKFSYAASFGFSEIPSKNAEKIKYLLEQFKEINLREKSALNMISDIDAKKDSVLDPTFLLTKDEWISKMKLKKDNSKNYIFVYMIDETEEIIEKIHQIADREKIEIIHIRDGFRDLKNINSIRDASPQDFLRLLYNAKYTVVGSFHGLCLSLIFEKDFYYVLNKKYNRNSRLVDLLNILKLEDRKDFSKNYKINYTNTNNILNKDIKKSKRILDGIVKEINEKEK